MSLEQTLFAIAAAVCVAGSVAAVSVRDARGAGGALLATLLSLSVLYALLSAPLVAAAVIVIALFWIVPATLHLTATAPQAHPWPDAVGLAGAAAVISLPLLLVLLLTVASGELPLNVSVHSTDGYDVNAFGAVLVGRFAVSAVAAGVVVAVAFGAARIATRGRSR